MQGETFILEWLAWMCYTDIFVAWLQEYEKPRIPEQPGSPKQLLFYDLGHVQTSIPQILKNQHNPPSI